LNQKEYPDNKNILTAIGICGIVSKENRRFIHFYILVYLGILEENSRF